jgi:mono/diheme cytochrome c family protein
MRAGSMLCFCLVTFAIAAYSGCGGADLGDCPSNSEAQQAQGAAVLAEICTGCHSKTAANRHGAPDDVNLDDKDYVSSDKEEIYDEVAGGDMPPTGGLGAADREAVRVYLACGAK